MNTQCGSDNRCGQRIFFHQQHHSYLFLSRLRALPSVPIPILVRLFPLPTAVPRGGAIVTTAAAATALPPLLPRIAIPLLMLWGTGQGGMGSWLLPPEYENPSEDILLPFAPYLSSESV